MDERTAERDRHHLHLLSIFHFVAAGLAGLWALGNWATSRLMVDNFASFRSVAEGAAREPGEPEPPPFPWDGFGRLQEIVMTAFVVLAGALCLWTPFGTVLGIFTILVLCRPTVVERYGTDSADGIGGEPRPRETGGNRGNGGH